MNHIRIGNVLFFINEDDQTPFIHQNVFWQKKKTQMFFYIFLQFLYFFYIIYFLICIISILTKKKKKEQWREAEQPVRMHGS